LPSFIVAATTLGTWYVLTAELAAEETLVENIRRSSSGSIQLLTLRIFTGEYLLTKLLYFQNANRKTPPNG